MWFALQAADLAYTAKSPYRFEVVHYTPRLLTRLGHPFVRRSLEPGYRCSVNRLGRFLAARPEASDGGATSARRQAGSETCVPN